MDWQSDEIKKNFNGVIRDCRNLSKEELDSRYVTFKTHFEKLYDMAIYSVAQDKVQDSLRKLDMMLIARENMKSGRVNKLNTDMFVGNQLGKEFIYPLTANPSSNDYKRAVEKLTQETQDS